MMAPGPAALGLLLALALVHGGRPPALFLFTRSLLSPTASRAPCGPEERLRLLGSADQQT
jgi:hypothetical protein